MEGGECSHWSAGGEPATMGDVNESPSLNDQTRPFRALVALYGLAAGVMLGGLWSLASGSGNLAFGALALGSAINVAVLLWWVSRTRRADRAAFASTQSAAEELAQGAAVGEDAIGTVVASLPARHTQVAHSVGWPPVPAGARLLVAVATSLGARRVAVLAPHGTATWRRGRAIPVVCHPLHREAAAFDARVPPRSPALAGADRAVEGAPTNSEVVGGYGVGAIVLLISATASGVLTCAVVDLLAG